MHFSTIIAALVAATAASAAPELAKRTTYSKLSCFHSGDCSGGSDVLTVVDHGAVGKCLTLAGYKSVKVDELHRGCTVTVYTDSSCSNHATAAREGSCVSGRQWHSYSVDGC